VTRIALITLALLFAAPTVTEAGKIPQPTPPQRSKRPLPALTCPTKGEPATTNGSDMPGKP
jgi:hypothetical protein